MARRLDSPHSKSVRSLIKLLAAVICTFVLSLAHKGSYYHCEAFRLTGFVRKCNSQAVIQNVKISSSTNTGSISGNRALMMGAPDYEKQARSSKQINFLLTKAVDLINKMTSKKKKPKDGETEVEIIAAKKNMVRIPVKFSFSSTHKHSISLKDPVAALEYLSLPVEAYSVLDSNLVTRSLVADDTFIMSLPLGDLSSASQMATGGNMGVKLAATLRTEVTVRPDPSNGRVVMESGPIYFTPTAPRVKPTDTAVTAASTQTESTSEESEVVSSNSDVSDVSEGVVPKGFSDALPEWLLWGGRPTSTAGRNNNNVIDHNQEKYSNEENKSSGMTPDDAVKSSVQARFRIELHWKSFKVSELGELGEEKGLGGFMTNMRRSLFSRDTESVEVDSNLLTDSDSGVGGVGGVGDVSTVRATSDSERNSESIHISDDGSSRLKNGDSIEDKIEAVQGDVVGEVAEVVGGGVGAGGVVEEVVIEEEISLPVTAVVKVWVDVNLPVRDDLSNALSFPPIKILLSQAGALTTKAVLSTLAPVLGTLLVRDHDFRRKKISEKQNVSEENNYDSRSGSSSTSIRKSENIYDNLTADIEIK